ncbi:MAG: hypothetical protein EBV06_13670 [Planctomycetia bacterium]|nr:hypothetical protein [Planctomycetia bacterium]
MTKPGWVSLIGLTLVCAASSVSAQVNSTGPGLGNTPGSRPLGIGSTPLLPLFYGSALASPNRVGAGFAMPLGAGRPGIGVNPSMMGIGVSEGWNTGASVSNPALDLNQGYVTGHPVGFQNYRGYFLNLNAASGQSGAGGSGWGAAGIGSGMSPNTGIGSIGLQANSPARRAATRGR